MIWQGKELKTVDDIRQIVLACRTKPEAQEFLAAYSAVNPSARENIGYLTGFLDQKTATRIFDLFDCEHPVFGRNFPTPSEAFQMGVERAAKMMNRSVDSNPWAVGALKDLE